MLLQHFAKNQINFACQFSIKLEKHYFGPILTPFGQKITIQDMLSSKT